MKSNKVRILVFESLFLFKQGLVSILSDIESCEICEEYDNVSQFHSQIKMHQPQIVMVNSELMNEIPDNLLKSLKKEYPFFLICTLPEPNSAMPESIDQFILYSDNKPRIMEIIDQGIGMFIKKEPEKKIDKALSDREIDIVALVAKGLTNKEIAEKLFISVHTVITHRKNIGRKLGIKSASGITVYAILNKYIEMKDLY